MNNKKVTSLTDFIKNLTLIKLTKEVEELKKLEKRAQKNLVLGLLQSLKLKDEYTYEHSLRVAFYSGVAARAMSLKENEIFEAEMAGLLHDIGKVGVPDAILKKPARLDEDEFKQMSKHPEFSATTLENIPGFSKISLAVKHHHERFDGRGYPSKLKGENIPLLSRIVLIADTYDAMTTTRPYRKGLTQKIAFEELREFSGTQFDPFSVQNFIKGMKKEGENPTFKLLIFDDIELKKAA